MALELKVEAVLVAEATGSLITSKKDFIEVDLEGIKGDKHYGTSRKADARERGVEKGVEVWNWRQWSGVCQEELDQIARNLAVPKVDSSQLGANICFSGDNKFTSRIYRGAKLWFLHEAILYVVDENMPCIDPGKEITKEYPAVSPSAFPKAAMNLRGIVGVVYRPGIIRVGDLVKVEFPQIKT